MTRLGTMIDERSDEFRLNREAMEAELERLEAAQAEVMLGGGERYLARHRDRGRLLARERLDLLVDRDSPVLELSPLGGWGTNDPLGGGVVTALGCVSGHQCVIVANDPTVRGGAQTPTTVRKILRALEIARVNDLPLVNLVESGGADLPSQAQTFVAGGAIFKEISRLSRQRTPTIALVFGSSTAGGAYIPGMSDYTVFVARAAQVFLGGPPLVKMATNEEADEEELGGAEMHARTSGLADYLARDENEAIAIARRILEHIPPRQRVTPLESVPPVHDPEALSGVPSADARLPYDIREILARILDGSEFEEFKSLYGEKLVCGWGSLHGRRIGILGNNGVLFSPEAQKGAQFIQLCNQIGVPLLFIHNITGFIVGTRYEQGGIIKDGAKLINAVSNSAVPHLVLMVGNSYGAGNYAMAGRAYDPRFVFSWPSHKIAVMGGKQLAGVMSIVRRKSAAARGLAFDEEADAQQTAQIESQIETESTAFYATGQVWDDGIIDPRDTRTVLGLALSAVKSVEPTQPAYATFRM